MAKADTSFEVLRCMQSTAALNGAGRLVEEVAASRKTRPALSVAAVHQDAVTRGWATEMWARVLEAIGHAGIQFQSWTLGELTAPGSLAEAVRAAAEADVVVVSVRDAGDWPRQLDTWTECWLLGRGGRAGALVALIGVPSQPDPQAGRAHAYLEAVALRAGLDFLPRERKLPD